VRDLAGQKIKNAHSKEKKMSEKNAPNWIRTAARVDRPEIDWWYKPEDGPLDGVLTWRGQHDHALSGDVYNVYALRLADTGKVIGVSEKAGLRGLRAARVGSKVFIRPTGVKVLDGGRKMYQFEVFADQLEPLSEPVKGSGNRGGGEGE
jgi:hypothetical protein